MYRRVFIAFAIVAAVSLGVACTARPPRTGSAPDAGGGPAGDGPAGGDAAAPRLIVLVIIDMFRADYLDRFADRFGPDGFRRLQRDGAHFTSCFYPYALTETAPGNATLATGTTPNRHGIVGNSWFDADRGQVRAAIDDARYPLVGGRAGIDGASPAKLVTTTLADEIHQSSGGNSRVFGVAGKDRAAILSSGHNAAGAFWLDRHNGRFMSSTYYGDSLPGWVDTFNERFPIERLYGERWDVEGGATIMLTSDSGSADREYFEQFAITPFMDRRLMAFARELIEKESLGADGWTDYLSIGLSGHDWLGHEVGPYDPAIGALAVNTDRLIAELLQFLDERVGNDAYWLAVASDHGVVPTIDQARARGFDAGLLDRVALGVAMNDAVAARFGEDEWLFPAGSWTRLRINPAALERHGVSRAEVARTAGVAAGTVDRVLGYMAAADTNLDADTAAALRLSIHPDRSPDLLIIPRPYTLRKGDDPASHGTPYAYDTHVPLLLFGPPFRPGRYDVRISPADLAPTLAAALGIAPPGNASGRVLREALVNPGESHAAGKGF